MNVVLYETTVRTGLGAMNLSDDLVQCREPECGECFPKYAMPESGLCPAHEEQRVARLQERRWWFDEPDFALAQSARYLLWNWL